jgi:DNA topoisomerase-1
MLLYNQLLLQYGGKPKWTLLQYNGPLFPPLYKPHNIPIIIHNKEYILTDIAEEYATMYAKYLNTDYINNVKFKKNFWKDFKKVLSSKNDSIDISQINSIDDIDFTLIHKHLIDEKKNKIPLTPLEKEENEIKEEPYKYCIIDGIKQNVGNYRIEPPGIFIGRGNHPKTGHIKKRIQPEDITLNLSRNAPIPKPSICDSCKWHKIIHDRNVSWLASWKEHVTNKTKYIFTSDDSLFKSKSDEDKFELARKLKKKVVLIRETYEKQLLDNNMKTRQLATALYFIDNLALRVGGNKDTKEEADTVGATSLRVEHVILLDSNESDESKNNMIKIDFLGKDSIRFCKKIKVSENVYNNIKLFSENKTKKDLLFDLINAHLLNNYLHDFMPNLTAKVWRTYNASNLFQKEIDKIKLDSKTKIEPEERLNYLLSMFNYANTEVALLCNHQKGSTNKIDNILDKYNEKIKKYKKAIKGKSGDKVKRIKTKIKILKIKKEMKTKNVLLGTSKNNYIDPRIIFAFKKKYNIEQDKLFMTKTFLKRFEWAKNVDENFRF